MAERTDGRFRVWCPDRGDTEDDAREYFNLNYDVKDAAERWAEVDSGFNGDPWSHLEVMVREGKREPVLVELTVRAEPVFEARIKRDRPTLAHRPRVPSVREEAGGCDAASAQPWEASERQFHRLVLPSRMPLGRLGASAWFYWRSVSLGHQGCRRFCVHPGVRRQAYELGWLTLLPPRRRLPREVPVSTEAPFMAEARAVLTDKDRALTVRRWRTTGGCTWRAVAERAHARWDGAWSPPSNQLAGAALCTVAAEMLGEDPSEEPWN